MNVEAPPRPEGSAVEQATEVLIKEARRRQRRRWLFVAGTVLVLALAGRLVLAGLAGGGPLPPAHHRVPPPVHPQPTTPVPAPPASFTEFSGTWALNDDVVTIQGNGGGSVDWRTFTWCPSGTASPSDGVPCDRMAADGTITSGGHADLRLTAPSGATATAVVSGSTEPSVLPDGPANVRVSGQDVLYLTPSEPTTGGPFGRSALCGPTALALSTAQQKAAGISCGA